MAFDTLLQVQLLTPLLLFQHYCVLTMMPAQSTAGRAHAQFASCSIVGLWKEWLHLCSYLTRISHVSHNMLTQCHHSSARRRTCGSASSGDSGHRGLVGAARRRARLL